ncbi:uncharacterized protein LOC107047984 isoform X2 [Diachasma alloeum]|uniref:uncharacterized protein LOC107047984 isoform X2 n=1 Tax=Diachasma alloeum TaxID=454923 RepID=UPI00073829E0|nr:uncharacterized protein LOC107047984 isoform X2 [Diachasma alloeum]
MKNTVSKMNKNSKTGKAKTAKSKKHEDDIGQRASNAFKKQLEVLVEWAKAVPELSNAKLTNDVTRARIKQLWIKIQGQLNEMPSGTEKTVEQWKKSLHDRVRMVKAKVTAVNKSLNKTGGGPADHVDLTPEEEQTLAALVPKLLVTGNNDILESENEEDVDGAGADEVDATVDDKDDENNDDEKKVSVVDFSQVTPLTRDSYADAKLDDLEKPDVKEIDTKSDAGGLISNPEAPLPNIEVLMMEFESSLSKVEPREPKTESVAWNSQEPIQQTKLEVRNGGALNVKKDNHLTELNAVKKTKPPGSVINPFKVTVKTEDAAFPSKKRSMAVHRQDASLRNSENILALFNDELQMKRKYFDQQLYQGAKKARAMIFQSGVLSNISNKLYNPW